MAKLVLDRDAYGSRGQLSLMADFFEQCCTVRSLQLGHKVIADYLHDRAIRIPLHEVVLLNNDSDIGSAEVDDGDVLSDHASAADAKRMRANEDASRVLLLLRERKHYLGNSYPFDVAADGRLVRVSKRIFAYDVALSLALRHGCLKDADAAEDFERFVERCLYARRYRVFALGSKIRSAPNSGAVRFRAVFKALSNHMQVKPSTNATVPKRIHDGGVDVLARWDPVDDRPGCRTLVVQATVGKAETWYDKAHDPKIAMWIRLLGDPISPLVTLAVPHHVEQPQLLELVDNWRGATVFDRLRLVAHGPKITAAERGSVRELRRANVEW